MNRIIRLAIASISLALLAACGHSTPSESDAKAAIQDRLGDCEYFKVSDFEKTNGRQLDDTDYMVSVKYTVELKPGKYSQKLRDFQEAFDQVKALRVKYGTRMEELSSAHVQKINADAQSGIRESAEEEDAYRNIGETDPVLSSITAQSKEIAAKLKADNNEGLPGFVRTIRQECPNLRVSSSFMTTFFNPGSDLNQLADGPKAEFNESFWMVKTDNGWQAAAQ
jgi:hypothetical protein